MNLHASYANFDSLFLVNSVCVKWVEKQIDKIFESIKPTYAQLKLNEFLVLNNFIFFNILKNTYYGNKLT
jgi:hypothetical protein